MKNIMVTGGAGYIGSTICDYFLKKKLKVVVIDNLSRGYKKLVNRKTNFYKLDLKEEKKIKRIIEKNKIDTIIHMAALIRVDESIKKPKIYYRNNVEGTVSLLKAAKNTTVKRFIFSSTCAVYGKLDKIKINEKDKASPLSPYGKYKLIAENKIKIFCKLNKINTVILRYFNVVGAQIKEKPYLGQINETGQLFQNICLYLQGKKKKLKIFGTKLKTKDGTCIRDFIHVMDLAEIHYLSAVYANEMKSSSETFNCGYGKGYSVKEVVETFAKESQKKISITEAPYKKGDIIKSVCNNKKILKKLKWKPNHNNLNIMVRDTIKWFNFLHKN
ncbi:UDP-glucose 4-epimerase GalE [Pelagibacteraceae bacterium]|nr:UDP-glucose 4-epimerase GalE [Pelagibacteraceae bacterium]